MNKYCPRCSQRYDDGGQRFCLRDGALLSLPDSYRLVGAALDGKYRIDALVGLGGFGAVYSAWHLGLDRQVAFKILQPNVALQAPEAVALFEGEAKTAARLHHEHIVAIHDAGRTADGLSYIAMEWLEGRPLDEVLKAEGRLSFERTSAILRQVTLALAHAHAHRTVHRDLKPSNVMLIQSPAGRADGGEQVKVVDFGIAKVLSSSAGSMVSRSIGTPAYASPEQWKHGAQIDGRADIYSLGVMLYEMLAGRLPFSARSVEELIQVKLNASPLPLAGFLPGAPAAMDDLLRRMMAVDPALRPRTVGEVPALFDAARQTHSDLLRAPTVAEPTEQMRPSEIERIVAPPEEVTRRSPRKPELPEARKPVERATPKPAVAEPSRSLKKRVGVVASALAAMAMIGYASWSQLSRTTTNTPQPGSVAPVTFTDDLANGVKIELIKLPGGEFTMGSNDGSYDEKPPHQVKVSPFAIGKYEVTQKQWTAVMGENPSNFKGSDDLPVENVSWEMIQNFLKRLNGRYRLPTEAEWEYAARAGSQGRYSFGDDENELRNYAWFSGNSNSQTHPVGKLKPNRFGLFDMYGNVWEWCSDWYDAGYYKQNVGTNPQGPSTGSDRVFRGGGWDNFAVYCRSANRAGGSPGDRGALGFRLVRVGP